MIQLGEKISVVLISQVKHVYKSTFELVNGASFDDYKALSVIQFSQEPDRSASGLRYVQNIKAIISGTNSTMKFNNQKTLIKIPLTDGRSMVIGDIETPVLVTITPAENCFIMECKRFTLIPAEF